MRVYESRKRILVTGGAGFLGSHLCDRLLDQGHEVLCADNLFTGTKRNIDHLHGHPHFEFIRHDVTFPLFVEVAGDVRVRRDVVAHELEARMRAQVRDVLGVPGDEVVEPHHLVPVGEEAVAQVRAEESGGAGDEHPHAAPRPIERYVNPSDAMRAGSYRLRPSTMTGRASADFMRAKSGCRYSFQSVTIARASAPLSAS